MSRLYSHLAEVVETADGGFNMTRKGRQYFGRFLRQHGKTLQSVKTHAALIDILRECNAADFAALRERRHLDPVPEECMGTAGAGRQAEHRLVA
ncbi:MAG TPA: hypothetical protein VFF03_14225 [Rhodocyclaceae bacterium]|nr:hypothetical protein [Rhodocyclaceae bacterium]